MDRTLSPAHIDSLRNTVDFIAPQNTPVLVAADGKVVFVNDDSNVGGPDPSYWNTTYFTTLNIHLANTLNTITSSILVQKYGMTL